MPRPSAANTASACAAGSVSASAERSAHERRRAGRGHGHREHAGEQRDRPPDGARAAAPARSAAASRTRTRPARFSPISVNSAASAATTAGDCSWKPQPSCSPPARSASSRPASATKDSDHAGGVGQAAGEQRAPVVGMGREAEHLQRQHREHAGHQVQQRAAGQRQQQRQRRSRWPPAGRRPAPQPARRRRRTPAAVPAPALRPATASVTATWSSAPAAWPGAASTTGIAAGSRCAAGPAARAPTRRRRPRRAVPARGVVDHAGRLGEQTAGPGRCHAAGRPLTSTTSALPSTAALRLRAPAAAAARPAARLANSAACGRRGGLRRHAQREVADFGNADVLAHQPLGVQLARRASSPRKPAGTVTGTGSSSVPS